MRDDDRIRRAAGEIIEQAILANFVRLGPIVRRRRGDTHDAIRVGRTEGSVVVRIHRGKRTMKLSLLSNNTGPLYNIISEHARGHGPTSIPVEL